MNDLDSRNYDIRDIEIDPRFKVCHREMLLTFGVWFLYTIAVLLVAYTLGKGPVEQYKYIMGLPAWWFAVIMVAVIFAGIVIYIALNVFQDVELTDEPTITSRKQVPVSSATQKGVEG